MRLGLGRDAHLAWAKARALAYLDAGDIGNAVVSMTRDCDKHFDLATHPELMVGIRQLERWLDEDARSEVRQWIEGFR